MGIFPDAQGQLAPQSLVQSSQILNSSKMLWMSSLPASKKKIRSKMEELECSQDFPHYNPMGAFCCHGNQSSNPIWPKTLCSLSPTPMRLLLKNLIAIGTLVAEIFMFESVNGQTEASYFGYLCCFLPLRGLDTQEMTLATKVSNLRNKSHLYSKMNTCVSNCPKFITT